MLCRVQIGLKGSSYGKYLRLRRQGHPCLAELYRKNDLHLTMYILSDILYPAKEHDVPVRCSHGIRGDAPTA